jgi:hypothetical protein
MNVLKDALAIPSLNPATQPSNKKHLTNMEKTWQKDVVKNVIT